MLACVPPRLWNQHWEKTPAEIVLVTEDSEWNKLLIEGWAKATINHRDVDWAQVLLPECSSIYYVHLQYKEKLITELLSVIPQDRINGFIREILAEYEDRAFNSANPAWRLLSHSCHYWDVKLSNLMLSKIQENLQGNHWQHDWQSREHMQKFALYMEPSLAHQAPNLLSVCPGSWQQAIDNFLAILQFRWEMIQALQN